MGDVRMTCQNSSSRVPHSVLSATALCGCLLSPWVLADSMSIQANNFTLQNALISSMNTGKVSAEGHFNNSAINGGAYNSMGVSASGVSITASNVSHSVSGQGAGSSTISGMTINTHNTGDVSATGSFQGGNIAGSHNGMSVQAAGSAVTVSNIR